MHKTIWLALIISFSSNATKGLIEADVLASPTGEENTQVPNPKINTGDTNKVFDLNLTDRTNQAMTLTSLNATQEVFDKSSATANTLVTNYSPVKTVKVRVREFMGTLIILPKGDKIKMFKLGDPDNFTFEPTMDEYDDELPDSGTANVTLAGADTSLHIKGTSGNYYTFYLRGDTWDSKYDPTMKVIITDDKLLAKLEAQKRREALQREREEKEKQSLAVNDKELENPDYLEKVEFNPSNLDFGYRIKGGDETLRPFMVYSDGSFTYFRFAKGDSVSNVNSFPALYRVADKSDVPVNTTAQGSTIRAEGVANNWTLRLGEKHLCIEKMVKTPMPVSSMNTISSSDSDDETRFFGSEKEGE